MSALFELVQVRLHGSSLTHRLRYLSLPAGERGCGFPLLKGLPPLLSHPPAKQKCPRPGHASMEAPRLPARLAGLLAGRELWTHAAPQASELSCFSASSSQSALGSQGEHQPSEAHLGMAGICLYFCRPGHYTAHGACPCSCEDQQSCCCFRVKVGVLRYDSMAVGALLTLQGEAEL